MKRQILAVVIAVLLALSSVSTAHETDQFSVPATREFADLGPYFSHQFLDALVCAVDKTNTRIKKAAAIGSSDGRLQRLQSPDVIAAAVWHEFPWVVYHVENMEAALRNPSLRKRYPGMVVVHSPATWIYHHWGLLFDPTKLVRLKRSSTIMIDGTYLGTDKVVHFVHMGIIYYQAYRAALARGADEGEATRQAVSLGTTHLIYSENGLLGLLTTGVRSNADLAANYAGLKFFQNLTDWVRIRGVVRPPLFVRDGPYWKLAEGTRVHSDFLTCFVTDHWDEALNPNVYAPGMTQPLREAVRPYCADLLIRYANESGEPKTGKDFARITERLSSYYGEDYGYSRPPDVHVGIDQVCFPDEGIADARAVLVDSSANMGEAAVPETRGNRAASISVELRERIGRLGNDVDAWDRFGRSPLWWAIHGGTFDDIRLLITGGVDINHRDVDGESPVHWAARRGDVSVMELLLAHGAAANVTAVYDATPLHVAARGLHADVVRLLIEHGADVNARDEFGCTALHDVAARGDECLTAFLLDHGAMVDAADSQGTTPLHRAARAGHSETVARLLAAGANQQSTNLLGHTPRDEAVWGRHQTVIARLDPVTADTTK